MKWKVCGMQLKNNIQKVLLLKPDFMGFIFYEKSPRYAPKTLKPEDLQNVPNSVIKVGVFVNETVKNITQISKAYHLQAVQIYGLKPKDVFELKENDLKVISAFRIDHQFNFDLCNQYGEADYFLFDTLHQKDTYGGTGKKFSKNLLFKANLKKPFFVAGGIDLEDIPQLKNRAFAVDVNSKFEISPGNKDVEKLRKLKQILT